MVDVAVIGVVVAILAVILAVLIYVKNSSDDTASSGTGRRRAAVPTRDETGQIVGRQAPARPGGRRGGARMRRQVQEDEPEAVADDNADGGGGSDGEDDVRNVPSGKMGKKKLEKLAAKAEKKKEREAMEQEREERKKRQEKDEAEAKEKADKEAAEMAKIEEEERKKKEEKERQEYEEYLKIKATFDVQEEGFDETAEDDSENQLQTFIQYIKDIKVVPLEDLAAHFKMKTQDAIDRVTKLSEDGTLTGVMDDRGKFIYISQTELESVAKFIRQRGRVSITELAENSNKLIKLKQAEGS